MSLIRFDRRLPGVSAMNDLVSGRFGFVIDLSGMLDGGEVGDMGWMGARIEDVRTVVFEWSLACRVIHGHCHVGCVVEMIESGAGGVVRLGLGWGADTVTGVCRVVALDIRVAGA